MTKNINDQDGRRTATERLSGSQLQRIQDEELRAFSHEKNGEILDEMLEFGATHAVPRETSGLVEMQRWFIKFRAVESHRQTGTDTDKPESFDESQPAPGESEVER